MRLWNLIKGDIRFQMKYGFYFVYTVMIIFYICILAALPSSVKEKAGIIMVYSDPTAMGLFFMGAIVLLEKSQRVLNTIAISPVKVSEYILAKIVSLGFIGTLVGTILAVVAGHKNLFEIIVAIILGSALFTMFGLIIASKINSLNQFLVATIPMEILFFALPVFYLFGYRNQYLLLHPGCIILQMMSGTQGVSPWVLIYLCTWILLVYLITYKIIHKMFQSVGGVKL